MAVDIEKRNKRQYQWQKENTERMNLLFNKGTKERITSACASTGTSVSEFVRDAVESSLKEKGF